MKSMAVSLTDVLESKEDRARYQLYLIEKYKCPVVSFTVIMPGEIKQNKSSASIFLKGKRNIEASLKGYNVLYKDEKHKKTGSEAFYCVELPAKALKKLMAKAEDGSKMGRLFDIDVIDVHGQPVSRRELGMAERKCLICDSPAHACARNRRHSAEELLKEIERILSDE